MHHITTNIEKNRLIITLVGFVSEAEAVSIEKSLIQEIGKLSPNFDIITDISNFRLGLEEAGLVLREIIKYLKGHKVNRVVRVVGSSQSGVIQFANYTRSIESYNVKYVPTLEEAEKLLEKLEVPVSAR